MDSLPSSKLKKQTATGFTLIEVLIAIVVLTLGLLGMAKLQATGLKNNHSAYLRTQATILTYDILDRIRANRPRALSGDYNIAIDATTPTGTTVAITDLIAWRTNLANALPSGTGSIDCTTTAGLCNVIVQWDDSRGTEGASSQQFSVNSRP